MINALDVENILNDRNLMIKSMQDSSSKCTILFLKPLILCQLIWLFWSLISSGILLAAFRHTLIRFQYADNIGV